MGNMLIPSTYQRYSLEGTEDGGQGLYKIPVDFCFCYILVCYGFIWFYIVTFHHASYHELSFDSVSEFSQGIIDEILCG